MPFRVGGVAMASLSLLRLLLKDCMLFPLLACGEDPTRVARNSRLQSPRHSPGTAEDGQPIPRISRNPQAIYWPGWARNAVRRRRRRPTMPSRGSDANCKRSRHTSSSPIPPLASSWGCWSGDESRPTWELMRAGKYDASCNGACMPVSWPLGAGSWRWLVGLAVAASRG